MESAVLFTDLIPTLFIRVMSSWLLLMFCFGGTSGLSLGGTRGGGAPTTPTRRDSDPASLPSGGFVASRDLSLFAWTFWKQKSLEPSMTDWGGEKLKKSAP